MNAYRLEYILSYNGVLADRPELIGEVPEGIRINFYSAGGMVSGRVTGKVLPVGGDWMTIRRDGVGVLDVRTTFQTEDGALILVSYAGIAEYGEDAYNRFLRGRFPTTAKLRTTPRFTTSHPDYLWLNRMQCVGIGEYDSESNQARYDVYAVL
ncbi:MAG TPA: DUF3237 domain-containing protein [Bryobacteraceae bacterium]|nr:DUF3237 domain-containing protein [Bryobacteraceae bacterium]